MDVSWSPVKCARVGSDLAKLTVWGQNEPCHSLRRHGRSTSVSGPAGRRFRSGQAETLRPGASRDRKSTRLNSSHQIISYAVFCLKKKKKNNKQKSDARPNLI